jgi:hypothetical protein
MTRLIFALAAIATIHAQASGRAGSITILVIDTHGRSLPNWKVTSFRSNQQDATSLFKGLSAKDVPLGFYSYSVSGPSIDRWTPTAGGRVELLRPESLAVTVVTPDVISGLSVDRSLPQNFVIKGTLDPPPAPVADQRIWINIHSVIGPWSDINTLVDPSGDFRLYNPPSGICTVTVIREGVVLHSEAISFDQDVRSSSFVLKINEKPPALRRVTK